MDSMSGVQMGQGTSGGPCGSGEDLGLYPKSNEKLEGRV